MDAERVTDDPARRVLSLRNVGVFYERRRQAKHWALEDVSVDLSQGETLGIIGRNGAGKSTLLRLLSGIIRPDRGELINYGYQASLLSLQVGFLPHLSGRENIILTGLMLGMGYRDIRRRLDEIIAFAELEECIDDPIETYSSGMRARLGFSSAFHVDPDVLLIDEVLGVGDAEFLEKSKKVMQERIRSDKTVVLVSHNATLIRSLCDRAVWIDRGRTVAEGPALEVLDLYLASLKPS